MLYSAGAGRWVVAGGDARRERGCRTCRAYRHCRVSHIWGYCGAGRAWGDRGAGRACYQRGRFLTTNEKSFLMTLDAALGRNYRAFAQVRLAELVSPTLGANPASRRQALNGVMAKSVDFVICDVLTLDPVAAIEVDDRSHLLPERQQRDAFVNAVFLEIGLPLMRVKARRAYSVDELRVLCARAGLFTPPPPMEGANS